MVWVTDSARAGIGGAALSADALRPVGTAPRLSNTRSRLMAAGAVPVAFVLGVIIPQPVAHQHQHHPHHHQRRARSLFRGGGRMTVTMLNMLKIVTTEPLQLV